MAATSVEMRVTIQDLPQMKRLFDASMSLWESVQIHKDHISYLAAFDEWEDALIAMTEATESQETNP